MYWLENVVPLTFKILTTKVTKEFVTEHYVNTNSIYILLSVMRRKLTEKPGRLKETRDIWQTCSNEN